MPVDFSKKLKSQVVMDSSHSASKMSEEQILRFEKSIALNSAGIYKSAAAYNMDSDSLARFVARAKHNLDKALSCQLQIENLQSSKDID